MSFLTVLCRIFAFNHLFLLRDRKAVWEIAISLLSDPQLEVLTASVAVLTSLTPRTGARIGSAVPELYASQCHRG
jgi:hypothetical protein